MSWAHVFTPCWKSPTETHCPSELAHWRRYWLVLVTCLMPTHTKRGKAWWENGMHIELVNLSGTCWTKHLNTIDGFGKNNYTCIEQRPLVLSSSMCTHRLMLLLCLTFPPCVHTLRFHMHVWLHLCTDVDLKILFWIFIQHYLSYSLNEGNIINNLSSIHLLLCYLYMLPQKRRIWVWNKIILHHFKFFLLGFFIFFSLSVS